MMVKRALLLASALLVAGCTGAPVDGHVSPNRDTASVSAAPFKCDTDTTKIVARETTPFPSHRDDQPWAPVSKTTMPSRPKVAPGAIIPNPVALSRQDEYVRALERQRKAMDHLSPVDAELQRASLKRQIFDRP